MSTMDTWLARLTVEFISRRGHKMSTRHEPWPENILENVAKVLGDTIDGLTGSEIGQLLNQLGIEDIAPGATKWRRLLVAFQNCQQKDRASNRVIRFIYSAMDPVRYTSDQGLFTQRIDTLWHAPRFGRHQLMLQT